MGAEVGSRLTSAVEARRVLGMRVDATSYEHAATEIMRLGQPWRVQVRLHRHREQRYRGARQPGLSAGDGACRSRDAGWHAAGLGPGPARCAWSDPGVRAGLDTHSVPARCGGGDPGRLLREHARSLGRSHHQFGSPVLRTSRSSTPTAHHSGRRLRKRTRRFASALRSPAFGCCSSGWAPRSRSYGWPLTGTCEP